MGTKLQLIPFDPSYEDKWDKFVLNSANGTFLQTRNFLNYHPYNRFQDSSVMILKGDEIVAVIPANCVLQADGDKVFFSHQGSTFGGIILKSSSMKIAVIDEIFDLLEEYFVSNGFHSVVLKQAGRIYCKYDMDLLDYFYYNKGYQPRFEVGFYIDFCQYAKDVVLNFSSSRRRDYKYSLKHEFRFVELNTEKDIDAFYSVLLDNYQKFDKKPVHTKKELIELYTVRLSDIVRFFGVFQENEMIAGAMVFCFGNEVFHTQYLAVQRKATDLFANEYMYTSLIRQALTDGFCCISFGTSTLNNGKSLNYNLAQYKEGFGTKQYNNLTFVKTIESKR